MRAVEVADAGVRVPDAVAELVLVAKEVPAERAPDAVPVAEKVPDVEAKVVGKALGDAAKQVDRKVIPDATVLVVRKETLVATELADVAGLPEAKALQRDIMLEIKGRLEQRALQPVTTRGIKGRPELKVLQPAITREIKDHQERKALQPVTTRQIKVRPGQKAPLPDTARVHRNMAPQVPIAEAQLTGLLADIKQEAPRTARQLTVRPRMVPRFRPMKVSTTSLPSSRLLRFRVSLWVSLLKTPRTTTTVPPPMERLSEQWVPKAIAVGLPGSKAVGSREAPQVSVEAMPLLADFAADSLAVMQVPADFAAAPADLAEVKDSARPAVAQADSAAAPVALAEVVVGLEAAV